MRRWWDDEAATEQENLPGGDGQAAN